MSLENAPFVSTRLEEEKAKDKGETFTVWINKEERRQLDEAKRFLHQPKDSTAFKMLAWGGLKLLGSDLGGYFLEARFISERRNKKYGRDFIE